MKKSGLLIGVFVVVGLSSCSGDGSDSQPPEQETSLRDSSVADITREAQAFQSKMKCEQTVPLTDDVWFWDRAVGFLCRTEAGNTTSVLVYQTPDSGEKSVADEGSALSRAVIVKNRLVISGDVEDLAELRRQDPGLPKPRTGEMAGKSLTGVEEDATFCARAVAAHGMLTIDGETEIASDVAALESVYPGYSNRVAEVDLEIEQQSLRQLYREDELAFEGAFSTLGPATKEFCNKIGAV